MHLCKIRISNQSGKLLTNARLGIFNLIPAQNDQRDFPLRGGITLADTESMPVTIASHVEGVRESAHLMSLQLPTHGGYLTASSGIVAGEQRFQLRLTRGDETLAEIRLRLFVNDFDVMHLETYE